IYYKAVRDIEAGEELLVYMKDGIFPEGSMAPNLQARFGKCLQEQRLKHTFTRLRLYTKSLCWAFPGLLNLASDSGIGY
ncbi:hypothetical protein GOODEAATRI_031934, partial [Goodea atripinnis]